MTPRGPWAAADFDLPKILSEIRVKSANHEWLNRHRDELRSRFPDRYVAVHQGAVVAADSSFRRLLARLKKQLPDTDPSLAAIEFLNKEEVVWVL